MGWLFLCPLIVHEPEGKARVMASGRGSFESDHAGRGLDGDFQAEGRRLCVILRRELHRTPRDDH